MKSESAINKIDEPAGWEWRQEPSDQQRNFLDGPELIRARRRNRRRFMQGKSQGRDVRILAWGSTPVRIFIGERHRKRRATWLTLTPDEARRLAESLIEATAA